MPSLHPSVVPLAVLAMLAAAPTASADDTRFEITPFGGYRMGGSFDAENTSGTGSGTVDLDDGSSWGVDLGLYRDPTSFYELLFSTQDSSFDSSDPTLRRVDVTTAYYHVGGTIFMPAEQWAIPYLSFTMGATQFSASQGYDSDTKFSLSLGGGLRLPFSDNFAATLGLRGFLTLVDSDTGLFCYSGPTTGGCLVKSSGSTYFQGEATLGLTFRF